jgi:DNA primase
MPFYSQEKIDEVNQAADLVELVSRYVTLKRAGSVYKGLCPFHSEKTPSFVVSPQRHRFHCFGCNKGGGAIQFLMLVENMSFPKALAEVARRSGVSLPEPDPSENREEINRAGLYKVMEKARDFYAARLKSAEGADARRYLDSRGLGRGISEAFGLGLAPEGWDGLVRHLAREGFSGQIAEQAGLIKTGREAGRFYDFFRGRVMVPITDAQDRVVAFGARVLPGTDETAKYINTGATPIYTKGDHLFGLRRARPFIRAAGLVYLVEGYFDLISLAAAGINEVVAAQGTALTDRQISLLKSLRVPIYLITDGDDAGRAVPVKNLPEFLNADLEVRVVTLPESDRQGEKQDPDTFVRSFGVEALKELSARAVDSFDFWIESLKGRDQASGGVSTQFRQLDEARELLKRLADPAKRQIVRRRLAGLLNIGENTLETGGRTPPPAPAPPPPAARPEPGTPPPDPTALALLGLIMVHTEAAGLVLGNTADYWPPDQSRLLFDRLQALFTARGEAGLAEAEGDDLPGPLASLVARAALEQRTFASGQAEGAARQHLARLVEKWARRRQAELSEGIAQAQAAGDGDGARRLAEEKKKVAERVRALAAKKIRHTS